MSDADFKRILDLRATLEYLMEVVEATTEHRRNRFSDDCRICRALGLAQKALTQQASREKAKS